MVNHEIRKLQILNDLIAQTLEVIEHRNAAFYGLPFAAMGYPQLGFGYGQTFGQAYPAQYPAVGTGFGITGASAYPFANQIGQIGGIPTPTMGIGSQTVAPWIGNGVGSRMGIGSVNPVW